VISVLSAIEGLKVRRPVMGAGCGASSGETVAGMALWRETVFAFL
jgi:hypothetical protein